MSSPRRPAGFFSTLADCPGIDPEFLEMQRKFDELKYSQGFLQPPGRLVTVEMLDAMTRP